jgi:hypothetical protein
MPALVQALVLAPVPDLDVAGLVKDVDRRRARHARRRAGAGPKAFDRRGGRHFSFEMRLSSFVPRAGVLGAYRAIEPLTTDAVHPHPGLRWGQSAGTFRDDTKSEKA